MAEECNSRRAMDPGALNASDLHWIRLQCLAFFCVFIFLSEEKEHLKQRADQGVM